MDDDRCRTEPTCAPRRGVLVDKLFIGVAFLLVGVLFSLEALGILHVRSIGAWWPAILIAVGLAKLIQPGTPKSRVWGAFLVVFFGYWLLHNLGLAATRPWKLWPLVLLFVGLSMILRAVGGPAAEPVPQPAVPGPLGPDPGLPDADGIAPPPTAAAVPPPSAGVRPAAVAPYPNALVSATALLGGVERHCVSQAFQGGDATAVMGGCVIDLRDAAIAVSPAVIETFAWWGGIEIRVPPDWVVVTEGTAVLGAFEDKTRQRAAAGGPTLVIRGVAIMGGVEIGN